MPALFELEAVRVDVEDRTILDIGRLALPDGGITVIVGTSGSGKSTLLRLLNRLEVPSSGRVLFRGTPIDEIDPLAHRRRVGMVFQRAAPFPGTVRDNLAVAHGSVDEPLFASLLERAGLDRSLMDRQADDLSGGEAQRMCLARSLAAGPEVLLLDEPTSALDPPATRAMEQRARAAADAGTPLVWVTHDLDQAHNLADEIVVLDEGRVVEGDRREAFLAGHPVRAEGPGEVAGDE